MRVKLIKVSHISLSHNYTVNMIYVIFLAVKKLKLIILIVCRYFSYKIIYQNICVSLYIMFMT